MSGRSGDGVPRRTFLRYGADLAPRWLCQLQLAPCVPFQDTPPPLTVPIHLKSWMN
jgi:hypothetical protein